MKRITALLLALITALSLSACGKKAPVEAPDTPSNSPHIAETKAPEIISMDDIDWSVDEGIINGNRTALLSFTNNSPYPISEFEISFSQKDGLTEEEISQYTSEVLEFFDFDDEEDIEELKNTEISMHAKSRKIVLPGASITDARCYYYSGFYYMNNINHYSLVVPDMATIHYIDENKIYTAYYDFKSDKCSLDSSTEVAFQWPTTDLANKVPKPDALVVETYDNKSNLMFDAYGMTLEQFNSYIEECKSLGFVVDANWYDGFYSADDESGYNIYAYHDEDNDSMSVVVSAPNEPVDETIPPDEESEDNGEEVSYEFKEIMDSYEEFFDEYISFMKKYTESSDPTSLLTDYSNYMTKYADTMSKLSSIKTEELSLADATYYSEVMLRINQKLLEVMQ